MIKNGVCNQAFEMDTGDLVYCDRGDTHYPGGEHRGFSEDDGDIEWCVYSERERLPWQHTVNDRGEVIRG